jgi:hypothetical protein
MASPVVDGSAAFRAACRCKSDSEIKILHEIHCQKHDTRYRHPPSLSACDQLVAPMYVWSSATRDNPRPSFVTTDDQASQQEVCADDRA